MKTSIKINLLLIGIIISYVLIKISGEHLGGPLGLFLFMNLFSNDWLYGLVPVIGIVLLIAIMFSDRKVLLYGIAMLCLYTCLILYVIGLIRDRAFVDEVTPILSMIPFVILTIVGIIVLKSSPKIS